MNKNLAIFLITVIGIFVFAVVIWASVPRRDTAMEPVSATTDYADITVATRLVG